MNLILGWVCCTIAGLMVLGLALLACHNWGYKAGHKDGYAMGRKDADNWWVRTEEQVDHVRQNIWREEAQL
jgi:hypothetical protein